MAQIPDLLQLCAEEVANCAKANKKIRRHLKHIQFPRVKISYIKKRLYKTCDFSKFIQKDMGSSIIIPSVAKMGQNYEFQITVGSDKKIYISTLGDLGKDMLKLDFPMGVYGLFPFNDGYVLTMKDYSPKIQDVIHVFDSCSGDKGLCGTYHHNHVQDFDHLRIFNRYINEYIHDDDWWRITIGEYQIRGVVDILEGYNNIPLLFYLTENIIVDDLSKITLTCASEINNCGNVEVCWYVLHSEKGRIGIAVKQKCFFATIGNEAGVGLFALHGFRAIGNFNPRPPENVKKVFERNHYYECEFNPCSCDFSHRSTVERQYFGGVLSPHTIRCIRKKMAKSKKPLRTILRQM